MKDIAINNLDLSVMFKENYSMSRLGRIEGLADVYIYIERGRERGKHIERNDKELKTKLL